MQRPSTDYSITGTTLTFTTAPINAIDIQIREIPAGINGSNGYTGSAGSGYTGSAGTFTATTTQAIVTTNTTTSTSTSTGALQVAGGAGIAGNLYIGGTTYITGDLIPTSNNTVNIGNATNRFGSLYLAANTIDLGGTTITTTPTGELLFTTQAGNVSLTANAINFLSSVANTSTNQGDLNVTGNLTVDKIYAGSYFYANGTSFTGGVGYTGSQGTQGTQGVVGYTGSAGTGGGGGSTAQSVTGFYPGLNTAQVGTMRRYFASNIAITKITTWVSSVSTSNLTISLKKNGINTANVTVTANSYIASTALSANLVADTDYITLDISSGSGTDIGIRLDYTSS
jgi:hypothetical protein